MRSWVHWVEDGEVSAAFFYRLEKKRAPDRWVAALGEPDGTLVSSSSDECASFVTFYSSLFSASCKDFSVQDSLLANISSFLYPMGNQASPCKGLFTFGECHSALLGMARRKARGSDDLPMEFYIGFWKSSVRTCSMFLMHTMPPAPCPCPNDLGLFLLSLSVEIGWTLVTGAPSLCLM